MHTKKNTFSSHHYSTHITKKKQKITTLGVVKAEDHHKFSSSHRKIAEIIAFEKLTASINRLENRE